MWMLLLIGYMRLHLDTCMFKIQDSNPGVSNLKFTIFSFLFFKLWKYDNTFTGDLEDTEQSYV